MHLGNHRLRHRLQGIHHADAHIKQLPRLQKRDTRHVAKTVTRAEHRAIGRKDDATRVCIAHRVKSLRQFQQHRHGQCVALVGPVQRDGSDRAIYRQ